MIIVVALVAVALGAGAWWWFTQREGDDAAPSNPGTATPVVDPNAGSKRNWLEGTAGAVAGRHFHIGERTVTLGRKPQNFIQVADTRASRTHANLRPTAEGLLLTDMRSKHGTFVNGKLAQSATLQDGDVIGIGDCKLVFRREAKFATDDAQRAKAIDAAMTGETSADFGAMARKVIAECGGDLEEASRRLGLPVDVLKNLLKTN